MATLAPGWIVSSSPNRSTTLVLPGGSKWKLPAVMYISGHHTVSSRSNTTSDGRRSRSSSPPPRRVDASGDRGVPLARGSSKDDRRPAFPARRPCSNVFGRRLASAKWTLLGLLEPAGRCRDFIRPADERFRPAEGNARPAHNPARAAAARRPPRTLPVDDPAMDVEYEGTPPQPRPSTTAGRWRRAAARRAPGARRSEAKIAAAYARIDAGDTVADLTAPAAVKRIKDMDRLGIGHDVGMYLAYPERRGYDEHASRGDGNDATDDKTVSLGDGVMVRRADPNMRGEDPIRRMPLVKVGGEASAKGKRGGAPRSPRRAPCRSVNAAVLHRAGAGRGSEVKTRGRWRWDRWVPRW